MSSKSNEIGFRAYKDESELCLVQGLIEQELSEPYSVFTYRYFVNQWPKLCLLAMHGDECIGTIVGKIDVDHNRQKRGYIAMLAVQKAHRNKKIGSQLVQKVIEQMQAMQVDLVVLETEVSNKGALGLYEKLNFVRDKRLNKYYLNGGDAFRLKLWLSSPVQAKDENVHG